MLNPVMSVNNNKLAKDSQNTMLIQFTLGSVELNHSVLIYHCYKKKKGKVCPVTGL
jgi:hypothetical protein